MIIELSDVQKCKSPLENYHMVSVCKVKSIQEAYCECNTYIEICNLANHMKKQNKKHDNDRFIDEKLKTI